MLVLSRKKGQQIKIGDNITVVVRRIKGNQVSIGIEAPREVKVWRREVYDQLKAEGENVDGK